MFVHNIQKTGLFSEIRKVIQKVLRLLLWKIYNFIIWVSLSFTKNIFQIIFGCVIWVWGEFRFFSIGDIEQLFKSGHSISISQKNNFLVNDQFTIAARRKYVRNRLKNEYSAKIAK